MDELVVGFRRTARRVVSVGLSLMTVIKSFENVGTFVCLLFLQILISRTRSLHTLDPRVSFVFF